MHKKNNNRITFLDVKFDFFSIAISDKKKKFYKSCMFLYMTSLINHSVSSYINLDNHISALA